MPARRVGGGVSAKKPKEKIVGKPMKTERIASKPFKPTKKKR